MYLNGTNEEDNGGVSLYAGEVTAIDEAYDHSEDMPKILLTFLDTWSPHYRRRILDSKL